MCLCCPQVKRVTRIEEKGVNLRLQEAMYKKVADVVIPLHANSGADAISSFFGKGKKVIFDRVSESDEYRSLLSSVGQTLPVSHRTVDDLRMFTMQCVYNDKTSKTLGEARAKKWSTMKRKSTASLPPDEESHYLRALRVAYQVYVWLHFEMPDAPPSPLQNGWQMVDGKCVPIRYRSAALPQELNIMRTKHQSGNSEDSDTSDEGDESESEHGEDSDSEGEYD